MSEFSFIIPVICALLLIGLIWACIRTNKKYAEDRKHMTDEEKRKEAEEQQHRKRAMGFYFFGFMGKPPIN